MSSSDSECVNSEWKKRDRSNSGLDLPITGRSAVQFMSATTPTRVNNRCIISAAKFQWECATLCGTPNTTSWLVWSIYYLIDQYDNSVFDMLAIDR